VPVLLERDAELDLLHRAVVAAAGGHGSTALLLGEAGIGKTSLVQAWLATLPDSTRVLVGSCEDLRTPRALGPLRDAAEGTDGPLRQALATGTDPEVVLPAVVAELCADPRPTVLVVDDAHWADGATLDVVRYVARRIDAMPAVLLLAYRDDVVDPGHPLRQVLGAMPGSSTARLRLLPLSAGAVDELASGAGVDVPELYRTSPARWVETCDDELGARTTLIRDYGLREFTLWVACAGQEAPSFEEPAERNRAGLRD